MMLWINIGDDVASDVGDDAVDEVLDDAENVGDCVQNLKFIFSIGRMASKFNPE